MKKVLIVGGLCFVLLLCAVVVGVGGYFGYKYLQDSPEVAWTDAFNELEEGDYYKADVDMSVTMDMEIPQYPTQTLEMTTTGTGEFDIKNEASYVETAVTTDGSTVTSKVYTIGNDMYTETFAGEYMKSDISEDTAIDTSQTLENIKDRTDYTVLEDEKVDGVDTYHYSIDLTDEELEDFTDAFTESTTGDADMDVSDVTAEGGKVEVWIAKDSKKLVRVRFTIDLITVKAVSEGIAIDMMMKNLLVDTSYYDWGVKNTIEAPM